MARSVMSHLPLIQLAERRMSERTDHQSPRHHVVESLLLRRPSRHHVTDVQDHSRDDLAEEPAGRLAESDPVPLEVGYLDRERHLAEGRLLGTRFHEGEVEPYGDYQDDIQHCSETRDNATSVVRVAAAQGGAGDGTQDAEDDPHHDAENDRIDKVSDDAAPEARVKRGAGMCSCVGHVYSPLFAREGFGFGEVRACASPGSLRPGRAALVSLRSIPPA